MQLRMKNQHVTVAAAFTPPGDVAQLHKTADVTKSKEVPLVDPSIFNEGILRYKAAKWVEPPSAIRPSIHQFIAVRELVRVGTCYVDFAIFAPRHIRTQRSNIGKGVIGGGCRWTPIRARSTRPAGFRHVDAMLQGI